MSKSSKNNNSEQAISEKFSLSRANKMEIEACTNNAQLSSFGGLALLREEEAYLDLSHQLASCIKDKRTKHLVRHSLEELIMTRIFQICLGYEDVNDCDRTRKEPMLQMAVHNGEFDRDICSSATMCRFENSVTEEDLVAIQEMFVTMFILSYRGKAPAHIILDCDDTNVDTYGTQEGVLFNTYYDSYCYMPLLVFEGHSGKMILPLLKPGRRSKTANICDTLQWLILAIKAAWPHTAILVRGDSHFCSFEFMDWIKRETIQRVYFLTGISKNQRLMNHEKVVALCEKVKEMYAQKNRPIKEYEEFYYKAKSWAYSQRVVVKVEMTQAGGELNIRFVVTNLKSVCKENLYETTYCGRGRDELFIRQFKEGVQGDRLSCHTFNANRLRIFIHAAAYSLMHSIRERALKYTSMERASLLTIRERLLLMAVSVRQLKHKVIIDYPKYNPVIDVLRHALNFYSKAA
jgi:hypothetical protein